jgi:agmatinase
MSLTPTFAAAPSFLGQGAAADAMVTVAGIPFDVGTSNRPGARFGPAAIRAASRMLIDGDHPVAWRRPAAWVADVGNFEIALGDIPASLKLIEAQAASVPHLVSLGGDHSITLPLLRALAGRGREPVALVHFDAHVDTWPESFGQVYGHGSPFYHAIEEGLVQPARMVQVGIRSPVERTVFEWTLSRGVQVIDAATVHEQGPAAIAARIRACIGQERCYLSFDIDALDPSCAPGTGTPEVGGLFTWQAQSIVRRLQGVRFVGMDAVEVAPAYDVSEITALAAATMVWEYLALLETA